MSNLRRTGAVAALILTFTIAAFAGTIHSPGVVPPPPPPSEEKSTSTASTSITTYMLLTILGLIS